MFLMFHVYQPTPSSPFSTTTISLFSLYISCLTILLLNDSKSEASKSKDKIQTEKSPNISVMIPLVYDHPKP